MPTTKGNGLLLTSKALDSLLTVEEDSSPLVMYWMAWIPSQDRRPNIPASTPFTYQMKDGKRLGRLLISSISSSTDALGPLAPMLQFASWSKILSPVRALQKTLSKKSAL